jgi:hypothetical protein
MVAASGEAATKALLARRRQGSCDWGGLGSEGLFEAAQQVMEGRGYRNTRWRDSEKVREAVATYEIGGHVDATVRVARLGRGVEGSVGPLELQVEPLHLIVVGTAVEQYFWRTCLSLKGDWRGSCARWQRRSSQHGRGR